MTVESEHVQIVRLDDMTWPEPVHFIKLDVQRMELPALHGAKELLRRDKPVLMIETPDEPIVSFLAGLGTRRGTSSTASSHGRPCWPLNVLFVA